MKLIYSNSSIEVYEDGEDVYVEVPCRETNEDGDDQTCSGILSITEAKELSEALYKYMKERNKK